MRLEFLQGKTRTIAWARDYIVEYNQRERQREFTWEFPNLTKSHPPSVQLSGEAFHLSTRQRHLHLIYTWNLDVSNFTFWWDEFISRNSSPILHHLVPKTWSIFPRQSSLSFCHLLITFSCACYIFLLFLFSWWGLDLGNQIGIGLNVSSP
jgi:hypothetical protein